MTIAEAGSDLDVTVKATLAEGNPISSHYTVPAAGGEGKIIESPYEAVSSKRMGPSRRDLSFSKGGKILYTTRNRVSAEGKTITTTAKGTDLAGKPVDATIVYDKE